jgi:hypothetical protein
MYTFTVLLMLARNRHNSLNEYWSKDVALNSKILAVTTAGGAFLTIFLIMKDKQELNIMRCVMFLTSA